VRLNNRMRIALISCALPSVRLSKIATLNQRLEIHITPTAPTAATCIMAACDVSAS
jgi:hypothetical protein